MGTQEAGSNVAGSIRLAVGAIALNRPPKDMREVGNNATGIKRATGSVAPTLTGGVIDNTTGILKPAVGASASLARICHC